MRIRKGDTVQIIAGDDKGVTGKVLRVLHEENKLVVEGVNRVYKHVKPTQRNPRGGRLSKEMPVHISNVLLVDPAVGKGVRVGVTTNSAGAKVLVSRKTGRELRVIRPAKHDQQAKSE